MHSELLASSGGRTAYVWRATRPNPVSALAWHKRPVKHVAWSPFEEAALLATCSADGNIHIWDVRIKDRPVEQPPGPRRHRSRSRKPIYFTPRAHHPGI